jgi:hypothetical protein
LKRSPLFAVEPVGAALHPDTIPCSADEPG